MLTLFFFLHASNSLYYIISIHYFYAFSVLNFNIIIQCEKGVSIVYLCHSSITFFSIYFMKAQNYIPTHHTHIILLNCLVLKYNLSLYRISLE